MLDLCLHMSLCHRHTDAYDNSAFVLSGTALSVALSITVHNYVLCRWFNSGVAWQFSADVDVKTGV